MTVIAVVFVALIANLCTKTAAESLPRPPSIEKQPGVEQLFRVIQSGDIKPSHLDCEASGNPEPKFRWLKNGVPFNHNIFDKRIIQEPKQGTLLFTKPEPEDEGVYQCFAYNDHGTAVSNTVFFRRSELNSFPDDSPEEKYVVEGEPLTLNCTSPLGYPEPHILWILTNGGSGITSINNPRITVDPNGSLHFSNVTKEDLLQDLQYACSAAWLIHNELKIGKRIILKLETNDTAAVTKPQSLVKQYVSPPRIMVLRGQTLDLHCIYGGTPLPNISFKKPGRVLKGSRYTYPNFGKTLQIKSVDFDDEGTYECTATNDFGRQETNTMTVQVQSVPFWKISPNSTNIDDGESIRFECEADGVPEPTVEWFVNGEPLSKSYNDRRKLEGNVLTIENLVKTDTAVYQCNASNVNGYAFKDFYLNVLAIQPSIIEKPKGLTKAFVNSTTILKCRVFGAPKPEIKWLRNKVEVQGDRYQITAEGDLRILNVSNKDEGEYTCKAKNKFGETSATGSLEVQYYSETDTSGVTNLSVVATESTGHLAKADWLIGMLCVIALVIILAILVCIVKRNRGGKYSVHEKEAALGRDMDYGDEAGFDEYAKPMDPHKTGHVGSKSSLTSSLKHADGNDADSMTDYGEDDSSKFGEDGSFIGEYGKKKNSTPQNPTFV